MKSLPGHNAGSHTGRNMEGNLCGASPKANHHDFVLYNVGTGLPLGVWIMIFARVRNGRGLSEEWSLQSQDPIAMMRYGPSRHV